MGSLIRLLAVATICVSLAGCGSGAGDALDAGRAPGPFVFISDEAQPTVSQLYVAEADGTAFRKLTDSDEAELDPQWSPDGSKVAFGRAVDCSATSLGSCYELWTVNADGTDERRLAAASLDDPTGPVYSVEPTWSPDGDQIAYVQINEKPGSSALHLVDADGGNDRWLLDDVSAPAWSPDGTQIAFCRGGYGEDHIFLLDLDDGEVHQVTRTTMSDCEPDWSPDGRRIAFEQVDPYVTPFVEYDVFVMDADGTNRRKLVRSEALDGNPVWSPDGTQIAFVSDQDGDPAIYVVAADGTRRPRRLSTPRLDDYAIDWAPAPKR